MPETRQGIHVRVSPKLKAAVRNIARGNGRSVTKEIEIALIGHVTAETPGAQRHEMDKRFGVSEDAQ